MRLEANKTSEDSQIVGCERVDSLRVYAVILKDCPLQMVAIWLLTVIKTKWVDW